MRALYEDTDGNETAIASASEVFALAGLPMPDRDALRALLKYLEGEYLIEVIWTMGPTDQHLMIGHYGVVEVERLISSPEEETEHFPPLTQVTIYGDMINSNVAAASSNVNQTVNVSAQDANAWAREVTAAVTADTNLSENERAVILGNAEMLRERSGDPATSDPHRVKQLGNAVVAVLLGVAGTGTYDGLVQAGQALFG